MRRGPDPLPALRAAQHVRERFRIYKGSVSIVPKECGSYLQVPKWKAPSPFRATENYRTMAVEHLVFEGKQYELTVTVSRWARRQLARWLGRRRARAIPQVFYFRALGFFLKGASPTDAELDLLLDASGLKVIAEWLQKATFASASSRDWP